VLDRAVYLARATALRAEPRIAADSGGGGDDVFHFRARKSYQRRAPMFDAISSAATSMAARAPRRQLSAAARDGPDGS